MDDTSTAEATRTLVVDAVPSNVTQALDFVSDLLGSAGCPSRVRNQLEVCVDEVFANIASYAYGDGQGSIRIDVTILDDPAGVRIAFRDSGIAFDPLNREDPDISAPLENRGIGGLGIFITKKITDELKYERDGGYNVLTMVKRF